MASHWDVLLYIWPKNLSPGARIDLFSYDLETHLFLGGFHGEQICAKYFKSSDRCFEEWMAQINYWGMRNAYTSLHTIATQINYMFGLSRYSFFMQSTDLDLFLRPLCVSYMPIPLCLCMEEYLLRDTNPLNGYYYFKGLIREIYPG